MDMFSDLKKLVQPPVPAGEGYVHNLSEHARSALKADLDGLLRDVVRAQEFPYLAQLGQRAQTNFSRIRIPPGAVPKLAREIESLRHRLPPRSPLLGLAESAQRCGDRELIVSGNGAGNSAGAATVAPAPGQPARRAPNAPALLSETEQAQILKRAAAKVAVNFMSTSELDEPAMAAYFKYCLGRGEYDKVIGDLRRRADTEPRVWVWHLLVAAMRQAQHPDFSATVAQFHIWLEDHHPETLNDMLASDERHKFDARKIAAIEARELAQR